MDFATIGIGSCLLLTASTTILNKAAMWSYKKVIDISKAYPENSFKKTAYKIASTALFIFGLIFGTIACIGALTTTIVVGNCLGIGKTKTPSVSRLFAEIVGFIMPMSILQLGVMYLNFSEYNEILSSNDVSVRDIDDDVWERERVKRKESWTL